MRNICIFAHYDRDNIVAPYVFRYLTAIKEANFEIVFVTSTSLGDSDFEKINALCMDCIQRENIGHDFGSWSAGLAKYREHVTGRLLIANDSVYGPIGSFQAALERLTHKKADFYGMVKSREHVPHLQSWFLLFEPHVVRDDAFGRIFCNPPSPRTREEIIQNYELAATQELISSGFRCAALYDAEGRNFVRNPTSYLWRELVDNYGIPFVKVSILRDDPSRTMPDALWQSYLRTKAPELLEVVLDHTSRMRRGSASPARSRLELIEHKTIQLDDWLVHRGAIGSAKAISNAYQLAVFTYSRLRRLPSYRYRGGLGIWTRIRAMRITKRR